MTEEERAIQAQLEAPFPVDELDFRPADRGNTAVAYIDGEAVIRRLNEVFGPLGWSFDGDPLVISAGQPRRKGGEPPPHDVVWVVKGRLMIGGVIHADLGDAEANETTKAAWTDALKRCATHLGIGLYLRSLPKLEARSEDYGIPAGEKARLRRYLTIWRLLPLAGKTEADVCASMRVEDLAHLPEDRAKALIARLQALANGEPVETGETAQSNPPANRPPVNASPPAESPSPAPVPLRAAQSQNGGTGSTRAPAGDTHEITPPGKVTREQLATLKSLVSALGMGDDDKIAYLHPYHATQFSQLTEAEAAACIADLTPQAAHVQGAAS